MNVSGFSLLTLQNFRICHEGPRIELKSGLCVALLALFGLKVYTNHKTQQLSNTHIIHRC